MDINIDIKIFSQIIKTLPNYATNGSAGMDLFAAIEEDITLYPGKVEMISTGIGIAIPKGDIVGLIYPRSGLSAKYGVTLINCVGVIDSDYRGEIICPMINHGSVPYTISPCHRIAQLIFTPIYRGNFRLVEELGITERNDNGFGSSGK